MPDNCIFCKIISGKIPGNFIYQDDALVVVEDIAPQAPHHYLIFPRKHIPTTMDLTDDDRGLVGHVYQVAARIAREKGFADAGFRVVNNCNKEGGQVVWHIHFHLLGGRKMEWPPG